MANADFPRIVRGPNIEVARPRNGRPAYAWVQGWIVERAKGIESTPMRRSEAFEYLRQLRKDAHA